MRNLIKNKGEFSIKLIN